MQSAGCVALCGNVLPLMAIRMIGLCHSYRLDASTATSSLLLLPQLPSPPSLVLLFVSVCGSAPSSLALILIIITGFYRLF